MTSQYSADECRVRNDFVAPAFKEKNSCMRINISNCIVITDMSIFFNQIPTRVQLSETKRQMAWGGDEHH